MAVVARCVQARHVLGIKNSCPKTELWAVQLEMCVCVCVWGGGGGGSESRARVFFLQLLFSTPLLCHCTFKNEYRRGKGVRENGSAGAEEERERVKEREGGGGGGVLMCFLFCGKWHSTTAA